jgi:hypothetical protein
MLQISHILVLSQPAYVESRLCRVLSDACREASQSFPWKTWRRGRAA